jgi:hypothetical protein
MQGMQREDRFLKKKQPERWILGEKRTSPTEHVNLPQYEFPVPLAARSLKKQRRGLPSAIHQCAEEYSAMG